MGALRRLVALSTLPIVVIACGLPQSSEFEQITGDDVQFDLDQTSTTTSTTIPPTTIDATSTTIAETTTTEIPTELVLVYFVAGSQLNSVSVPITSPVSPAQVLAALVAGPQSDIGIGLRTTIPDQAGQEIAVQKDRGSAIIDLPADIFDTMPSRDQRLFFAQLVLTIGRLGGIAPVQFTQPGEPVTARTPTPSPSTTTRTCSSGRPPRRPPRRPLPPRHRPPRPARARPSAGEPNLG